MISGCNIVVLSDDWGRHPFSCQHLVKQLLPYNRVLWVNTIGYRKLTLTAYDIKRSFEKIGNWFKPRVKVEGEMKLPENLRVLNAICLPYGEYKIVRIFNRIMISRLVHKEYKKWAFSDPILLTTLPTAENFVDRVSAKLSVYYCVDDFTLWPGSEAELIQNLEDQLLPQVDLIVATSEKLAHTRKAGGRKTQLLTHGVDLDHFGSVHQARPAPEVEDLSSPIVAYFGLIDERCDLSLIAYLATTMPKVTFLVIGAWRVDPAPVSNFSNVHIMDKVDYEKLPSYLARVSALILPYLVNELTESVNPLKLKEYLATGLPVIATSLPEVVKLNRFVRTASGPKQFKEMLDKALTCRKAGDQENLQSYLSSESWTAKAEEFSGFITEIMAGKLGEET